MGATFVISKHYIPFKKLQCLFHLVKTMGYFWRSIKVFLYFPFAASIEPCKDLHTISVLPGSLSNGEKYSPYPIYTTTDKSETKFFCDFEILVYVYSLFVYSLVEHEDVYNQSISWLVDWCPACPKSREAESLLWLFSLVGRCICPCKPPCCHPPGPCKYMNYSLIIITYIHDGWPPDGLYCVVASSFESPSCCT